MSEIFSRNALYWGDEFQSMLKFKHAAIFGLGGVGGFCAEMLARAGVGKLTLVDFDTVSKSNINRQIIALNSTVGRKKTELFEKRLLDINPEISLNIIDDFYTGQTELEDVDFAADAIDTIRSKVSLLEYCVNRKISVVSSMGAGNRINPEQLYICDIADIENKNAPFVSSVIYQLGKKGIERGITVVASRETPFVPEKISETENIVTKSGEQLQFTKIVPASTPFVAGTAGIFMASYIIREFERKFKNG